MKRYLVGIMKIGFSLFVLWYLSHNSFLDFHLLKTLFYSPYWMAIITLLYIAVILFSSWRWKLLLNMQNIPLNQFQTIIPTYLGIAFNNLLPGGVGGDFYRCYFLFKHYSDKRNAIVLTILFDRIIGLIGVFILVAGFTLFNTKLAKLHHYSLYILLTSSIFIFGFVFLLYFTDIISNLNVIRNFNIKYAHKPWHRSLQQLSKAISIYKKNKFEILKCIIASLIIQVLIVITCRYLANTMNFLEISFPDYAIALGLTQIVNLIPIAPGGFGVGEAAFAKILQLLNPGIVATFATIFLAYRIVGLLIYLPALSVVMLRITKPTLTINHAE